MQGCQVLVAPYRHSLSNLPAPSMTTSARRVTTTPVGRPTAWLSSGRAAAAAAAAAAAVAQVA